MRALSCIPAAAASAPSCTAAPAALSPGQRSRERGWGAGLGPPLWALAGEPDALGDRLLRGGPGEKKGWGGDRGWGLAVLHQGPGIDSVLGAGDMLDGGAAPAWWGGMSERGTFQREPRDRPRWGSVGAVGQRAP